MRFRLFSTFLLKVATRREGETEVEVPLEQVQVGDVLVVRAGQAVPLDGTVVEGSAAVDESALTGESVPVEKQPGDGVIGATISENRMVRHARRPRGR